MYIHERKDWPEFTWDQAKLTGPLADVRHLQGRLLGRMEAIGFSLREEAMIEAKLWHGSRPAELSGQVGCEGWHDRASARSDDLFIPR